MGWRRDLPDQRDHVYALPRVALPPAVDLRALCPAVYDQGDLGSCVAHAVAGAVQVAQRKEKRPEYTPSRLFIYRQARWLEGSVSSDSGCAPRDGIKAAATKGCPREALWPYDVSKFTIDPPAAVWGDGARHKVLKYEAIAQETTLLKARLASRLPFVFGFTVYDSFMSDAVAASGAAPMPALSEGVQGGHSVLVVGYTPTTWLCRNSWGNSWGMGGYFTLPTAYLLDSNLSDDFWAVDLV
jgi:C1A family cysteine protease